MLLEKIVGQAIGEDHIDGSNRINTALIPLDVINVSSERLVFAYRAAVSLRHPPLHDQASCFSSFDRKLFR